MRSLVLFFILCFSGSIMAENRSQIYGYVEKVTLVDKNITLPAKLDTGAKSASLNAINIQEHLIKGIPYLRFTVPTDKGNYILEGEYVGRVKIKARHGEGNPHLLDVSHIKRPVVLLKIKLGDKVRAIQVNLTNRKRFLYPLLLGRDAIIDFNGAVDPALFFTLKSKSHSNNETQ